MDTIPPSHESKGSPELVDLPLVRPAAPWTVKLGFGPATGRIIAITPDFGELRAYLEDTPLEADPGRPCPATIAGPGNSVTVDLHAFGSWPLGLVGILSAGFAANAPDRYRLGVALPDEYRAGMPDLCVKAVCAVLDELPEEPEPDDGIPIDPVTETALELLRMNGLSTQVPDRSDLTGDRYGATTAKPPSDAVIAAARHYHESLAAGRPAEACHAALAATAARTGDVRERLAWAERALAAARAAGEPTLLVEALQAVAQNEPGPGAITSLRESIRILEGDAEIAKGRLVAARRLLTMILWDRNQAEPAAVAGSRWFDAAVAADDAGEANAAALWILDAADEGLPDVDRLQWAERAIEWADQVDKPSILQRSLLRLGEVRLEAGDLGGAAEAIERADAFTPDAGGSISVEQADIRLLRDYCGAAMALERTDVPEEYVPEFRLPAADARALVVSLGSRIAWGVNRSMLPISRYVAMAMRKAADFAKDPASIAVAAKARGDVELFDGKHPEALTQFVESLRTWDRFTAPLSTERIAETRTEWAELNWSVPVIHLAIAACHEQRGGKALARRHLVAAAEAFEVQGDFETARGTYLEMAELVAGMKQPREALAACHRAVRCVDRMPNLDSPATVKADTFIVGARLLIARGQHGPALQLAREGLLEAEATSDAAQISKIAECLFRCGDGDGAIEAERRAIAILESRRESEAIAAACSRIAGVFASRHQSAQAIEWIRKTVELASLVNAKPLQAIGLERLGEFLQAAHRHAEAIDVLGQLFTVLSGLDDVPAARIAAIHRRITSILHTCGDFDAALPHERLALDHYELAEAWQEGADAAYEFAELRLERHDYEAAIVLCRRGLQFASRSREPEESAIAHERIGDALHRACRFREAIVEYVAALQHVGRSPFPLMFRSACIRHEHGRCLMALNRSREATRWLTQALREFQLIAEWGHAAKVALRLAEAELHLKHPVEAARLRKLALELAERSGSDEIIAEAREKRDEDD